MFNHHQSWNVFSSKLNYTCVISLCYTKTLLDEKLLELRNLNNPSLEVSLAGKPGVVSLHPGMASVVSPCPSKYVNPICNVVFNLGKAETQWGSWSLGCWDAGNGGECGKMGELAMCGCGTCVLKDRSHKMTQLMTYAYVILNPCCPPGSCTSLSYSILKCLVMKKCRQIWHRLRSRMSKVTRTDMAGEEAEVWGNCYRWNTFKDNHAATWNSKPRQMGLGIHRLAK